MNTSNPDTHRTPDKHAWRKYSLRTLFFGVALIAVALGWARREVAFYQQRTHLESMLSDTYRKPHYTAWVTFVPPDPNDWGPTTTRLSDPGRGSPQRAMRTGLSNTPGFSFVADTMFLVSVEDGLDSARATKYADIFQVSIYLTDDLHTTAEPDYVVLARYSGERITILETDEIIVTVGPN